MAACQWARAKVYIFSIRARGGERVGGCGGDVGELVSCPQIS